MSNIILKFELSMAVPADGTGITITDDGGNTFTTSTVAQGKTVQELDYEGTWAPSDPVSGSDIVTIAYDAGVGALVGSAGGLVPSFSKVGVHIDVAYKTGSIYSGTKDISTTWFTEKQATKVNTIKVSGGDVDVNLGWGATPEDAAATKRTVLTGATEYVYVTGDYIGGEGLTGTAVIEQSVSRV